MSGRRNPSLLGFFSMIVTEICKKVLNAPSNQQNLRLRNYLTSRILPWSIDTLPNLKNLSGNYVSTLDPLVSCALSCYVSIITILPIDASFALYASSSMRAFCDSLSEEEAMNALDIITVSAKKSIQAYKEVYTIFTATRQYCRNKEVSYHKPSVITNLISHFIEESSLNEFNSKGETQKNVTHVMNKVFLKGMETKPKRYLPLLVQVAQLILNPTIWAFDKIENNKRFKRLLKNTINGINILISCVKYIDGNEDCLCLLLEYSLISLDNVRLVMNGLSSDKNKEDQLKTEKINNIKKEDFLELKSKIESLILLICSKSQESSKKISEGFFILAKLLEFYGIDSANEIVESLEKHSSSVESLEFTSNISLLKQIRTNEGHVSYMGLFGALGRRRIPVGEDLIKALKHCRMSKMVLPPNIIFSILNEVTSLTTVDKMNRQRELSGLLLESIEALINTLKTKNQSKKDIIKEIKKVGKLLLKFNTIYYGEQTAARRILFLIEKLDCLVPDSLVDMKNKNTNKKETEEMTVIEDVGRDEDLDTMRTPLFSLCSTCASSILLNGGKIPNLKCRFFITKEALSFNIKYHKIGDSLKFLIPCLAYSKNQTQQSGVQQVFKILSKMNKLETLESPSSRFIANVASSVVRDVLIIFTSPQDVLSPHVFVDLLLINTPSITEYHKIMLKPILDAVKSISSSEKVKLEMEDAIFIILSEMRTAKVPIATKLYNYVINEIIRLLSDSNKEMSSAIDLLIRISGDARPVDELVKNKISNNKVTSEEEMNTDVNESDICERAVSFLSNFKMMWDVLNLDSNTNLIVKEALLQARSIKIIDDIIPSTTNGSESGRENGTPIDINFELKIIKYLDNGIPLRRYRVMACVETISRIVKLSVNEGLKMLLNLRTVNQSPSMMDLFVLTLQYVSKTQKEGDKASGFSLEAIINNFGYNIDQRKANYYSAVLLALQISHADEINFLSLVSLVKFVINSENCSTLNATTKAGLREFLSSVNIDAQDYSKHMKQIQEVKKTRKNTNSKDVVSLDELLFLYSIRDCKDERIKYDEVISCICYLAEKRDGSMKEMLFISFLKTMIKILGQVSFSVATSSRIKEVTISIYRRNKTIKSLEFIFELIQILSSKTETIGTMLELITDNTDKLEKNRELMNNMVITFGSSISNYINKVINNDGNEIKRVVENIVNTFSTLRIDKVRKYIEVFDIDNTVFISDFVLKLKDISNLATCIDITLGLYADYRILEVFTNMIKTPQEDKDRQSILKYIDEYVTRPIFGECFKFKGPEEGRYVASIKDFSSSLFSRIKYNVKRDNQKNDNLRIISILKTFILKLKPEDLFNSMDSIFSIVNSNISDQKLTSLDIFNTYLQNLNNIENNENFDKLLDLSKTLESWLSDIVSSEKCKVDKTNCDIIKGIMESLIHLLDCEEQRSEILKVQLSLVCKLCIWCTKEDNLSMNVSLTHDMLVLYSIKVLELYGSKKDGVFSSDDIERLIEELTKNMSSSLLKIFIKIPKISEFNNNNNKDKLIVDNVENILSNGVEFIHALGKYASHLFPLIASMAFKCLILADEKGSYEYPIQAEEGVKGYDGNISGVYLFRLIHPFVPEDYVIRKRVLDVFVELSKDVVSTTLSSVTDIITTAANMIIKTKSEDEVWTIISLLSFFIIPFVTNEGASYSLIEKMIPSLVNLRSSIGNGASWCEACIGVLLSNMCMKSRPEYSSIQITSLINILKTGNNKRKPKNGDEIEEDDENDESEDELFSVKKKLKKSSVKKSNISSYNSKNTKIFKDFPISKVSPSEEFLTMVSIVRIVSIMAPLVIGPSKRLIILLVKKSSEYIISGMPLQSRKELQESYKTLTIDILRLMLPLLDEDNVPDEVFEIINVILSIENNTNSASHINALGDCIKAIVSQGTYVDQIIEIISNHLECKNDNIIKFTLLIVINVIQALEADSVIIIKGIQGSLISLIDMLPPVSSSSIELNTKVSTDESLETVVEMLRSAILVHCGRTFEDIVAEE